MTREENTALTDALGRVHLALPPTSTSHNTMHRQTVLDAIKELTLFQLREEAALKLIEQMETRGVRLKAQIEHLEAMLQGKLATEPTIAAGSQMRGVEQLPEG